MRRVLYLAELTEDAEENRTEFTEYTEKEVAHGAKEGKRNWTMDIGYR